MAAMLTEGTLFETAADRNVAHICELLRNDSGPWPLQADQRAFLRIIERRVGLGRAMPLAEVQEKLRAELSRALTEEQQKRFRITADRVKGIVNELRLNFRVQIGASRDAASGGYYLIASADEAEASSRQMFNQAVSMLRVVAIMRGPQLVAEELGQLRLELDPSSIPNPTGTSSKENING